MHAIKADIEEIRENKADPAGQEENEATASFPGLASRCIIESSCFDTPAGYREVNLDEPIGEPIKGLWFSSSYCHCCCFN